MSTNPKSSTDTKTLADETPEAFLRRNLTQVDNKEVLVPSITLDNSARAKKFFGKEALPESIKNRGLSFIEAAKKMLRDRYIYPEKNGNFVRPADDHHSIKTGLEKLNKIEAEWIKLKNPKIKDLMLVLCEEVNKSVFNSEKSNKKVLKELSRAENHVNWGKRDPVKSIVRLDDDTIQVRIDKPITTFTQAQEEEWMKILLPEKKRPKWFNDLSDWERKGLQIKVQDWALNKQREVPNLGDFLGVPPTTIRGYPGARNGYESTFQTFSRNPATGKFDTPPITMHKIRSGHISPSLIANDKERMNAVKDNIKQLILVGVKNKIKNGENIDKVLIDLQTLITPPSLEDIQMDGDRIKAIREIREEFKGRGFRDFLERNHVNVGTKLPNITIITSNYPVNKYRSLGNFLATFLVPSVILRAIENSRALSTLNRLADAIPAKQATPEQAMAKAALARIKEISGPWARIRNFFHTRPMNHNAERAALEQIAVSGLGGIRIGSCMSGKDREGAVSQHVAAMTAFYQKHGRLPPIPPMSKPEKQKIGSAFIDLKADREEYESILAKQFISGHDQIIAERNAKGSSGLKDSGGILGKKAIVEARKELHNLDIDAYDPGKLSNSMAKLNRVKLPSTKYGMLGGDYEVGNTYKALQAVITQDNTNNKSTLTSPTITPSANNAKLATGSLTNAAKPDSKTDLDTVPDTAPANNRTAKDNLVIPSVVDPVPSGQDPKDRDRSSSTRLS